MSSASGEMPTRGSVLMLLSILLSILLSVLLYCVCIYILRAVYMEVFKILQVFGL